MTLSTTSGPSHLWSSFFIGHVVYDILSIEQTLSLTLYSGLLAMGVVEVGHVISCLGGAECASFVAAFIWEVKSLRVSGNDSLIGSIPSSVVILRDRTEEHPLCWV